MSGQYDYSLNPFKCFVELLVRRVRFIEIDEFTVGFEFPLSGLQFAMQK